MSHRPGRIRSYAPEHASPFRFVDSDQAGIPATDARGQQQHLVQIVDDWEFENCSSAEHPTAKGPDI